MPTLFAAFLSLSAMTAEAPPVPADVDLRALYKPVRPVDLDVLRDIVEDLEGVPVPVPDPFQPGVMVHMSGTF
ncbi:MAG: hypothetical protein KC619_31925 [Myxococcales bacterium]|nr:hypothetical protein [Myxococcales bacterium]